ncbi:MAG TPA: glycosyltransferase family 4 protein [Acidimicrobiia bacterium]
MRIAYVCADSGIPVPGFKGASVHVRELSKAFLELGADLRLLVARIGNGQGHETGLHLQPIDGGRRVADPNPSIRGLLETLTPIDLVYERYSLWSTAAMDYAAEAGIPGVVEVNSPLIDEHQRHRGSLDVEWAEECARRVFTTARLVVAVSGSVADWVTRIAGRGCNVTVIPNGVDTERFGSLSAHGPNGTFTVGFCGSLKPWHGVGTLLEAVAMLLDRDPSYRLLVVGDGPEHEHLQATAEALGIGWAASFTGAVDYPSVPGYLAKMDAAAAPYPDLPDFYFSPLKLFEYLAASVPVVASRVGQVAEILEDGVTGVLCPPGDPRALAEAIARLRHDPARRTALARAGREAVVRRHTWRHVATEILAEVGLAETVAEVA